MVATPSFKFFRKMSFHFGGSYSGGVVAIRVFVLSWLRFDLNS